MSVCLSETGVRRYKTQTIDGHKVRSVQKTYQCSFDGWVVFVDGVKYFSNWLTRDEAIAAVLERLK